MCRILSTLLTLTGFIRVRLREGHMAGFGPSGKQDPVSIGVTSLDTKDVEQEAFELARGMSEQRQNLAAERREDSGPPVEVEVVQRRHDSQR